MTEDIDATPRTLGSTELAIGPMGIGTWAWGDSLYWRYGQGYRHEDLVRAFAICVEGGLSFFDTADTYGFGRSELILGELIRERPEPFILASKVFPYPWRLTAASRQAALQASLRRLGVEQLDLYQMHWPFPPVPIQTWMESFAQAYHAGHIRAVGVSNYSLRQMKLAREALARHQVKLASNQVPFNLIQRKVERSGLLEYCRQHQITLIAYSPLAQGLLTGKYTPASRPSWVRAVRYPRRLIARMEPLLGLLKEIGHGRGGKTQSQVAINWTICKGAFPIPGVKNARQAEDNLGALGWRLTEDELAALDAASEALFP